MKIKSITLEGLAKIEKELNKMFDVFAPTAESKVLTEKCLKVIMATDMELPKLQPIEDEVDEAPINRMLEEIKGEQPIKDAKVNIPKEDSANAKVLSPKGDFLTCSGCAEVIYNVLEDIKSPMTMDEMITVLEPFREGIPIFNGELKYQYIDAMTTDVAMDCPVCLKENSVSLTNYHKW